MRRTVSPSGTSSSNDGSRRYPGSCAASTTGVTPNSPRYLLNFNARCTPAPPIGG